MDVGDAVVGSTVGNVDVVVLLSVVVEVSVALLVVGDTDVGDNVTGDAEVGDTVRRRPSFRGHTWQSGNLANLQLCTDQTREVPLACRQPCVTAGGGAPWLAQLAAWPSTSVPSSQRSSPAK